MIAAVAAIANEGKLMRPYIVDAQVMGDNVLYTRPTVVGLRVFVETAAELSALLVDVVDLGNSAAAVSGYSIAGNQGRRRLRRPKDTRKMRPSSALWASPQPTIRNLWCW